MIKQKTVLEVKIGERIYELFVSGDSPLGEVYDALCQMVGVVVQKINDSQPKPQETKVEDSKIEELPQV